MSAICDQANCGCPAVSKGKCACHLRIVCMYPSCDKLKGLRSIYCGNHYHLMKYSVYACFRDGTRNGILLCEKHMIFALRVKKFRIHAFSNGKGVGECVACKRG